MITEEWVSCKVAKLLKEKGFDEACFAFYYVMPHRTAIAYDSNFPKNSDLSLIYAHKEFGSLPTLQMVCQWLRKVYNIHIWVEPNHDKEGLYNAHVKVGWWSNNWAGIGYNSHPKAVEAAITYCLDNLI